MGRMGVNGESANKQSSTDIHLKLVKHKFSVINFILFSDEVDEKRKKKISIFTRLLLDRSYFTEQRHFGFLCFCYFPNDDLLFLRNSSLFALIYFSLLLPIFFFFLSFHTHTHFRFSSSLLPFFRLFSFCFFA